MTKQDFLKIPGVSEKINQIAEKYGFTADELLTVIQKESNFTSSVYNEKKTAIGLIQFYRDKDKTYKTIGGKRYKLSDIEKMSDLEQLDLVDAYFQENHKQGNHPYITVALPTAADKGMDDILAQPNDSIAKANPPWQNEDGTVTKRSILKYVGADTDKTEKENINQEVITTEEVTTEDKPSQTQTVLGPDGKPIQIPIGEDVTESDIKKAETGEQRFKSWNDLEKNIDKLDKGRPVYIGDKRYKWNEDKKELLLIDKKGNFLSEEKQQAEKDAQELFREERVKTDSGTTEGSTPKEKVENVIEVKLKEKVETAEEKKLRELTEQIEDPTPPTLEKGVYIDHEGNIYQKSDEGKWRVLWNKGTQDNPIPIDPETGEPVKDEWGNFVVDPKDLKIDMEDEWQDYGDQAIDTRSLKEYTGDVNQFLKDIDENNNTAKKKSIGDHLKTAGKIGQSLLSGATTVLDAVGGPGAIVSYVMGKKGLEAAMKEVKPHQLPRLSPLFHQHLRQSRELAKKGFTPQESRQIQDKIDDAYRVGIDNAVRGTGGDRAKFLARSGVLDVHRSSALLDYAAKDAQLQRANEKKYTELMLFKENFDMERSEKLRAEDMEKQLTNKKSAMEFTSAAFSNVMSGLSGGTNTALINQYMRNMLNGGKDNTKLFSNVTGE